MEERYELIQTFKPVTIKLTEDHEELQREGWHKGDVIKAEREYINGKAKNAVFFGSKGRTVGAGGCVAFLGDNCELV